MLVMKLGSRGTLQIYSENMPPNKKQKTSDGVQSGLTKTEAYVSSKAEDDLGENWRDQCKNVLDSNAYALKNGILTDITFLVGPTASVFYAHRLILALGSPVFHAMFFGTLAEKGDTIKIPDVSPEGFQYLLRFIYSGEASWSNELDAFKTFVAADKYCVNRLKDECEKHLCSCKLSPSNVWIFLESSLYLNSQVISERCLNFLKYSTEIALLHPTFVDVSAKTIESLLSLDTLNISEIKLLQNVVRWAEKLSEVEGAGSFESIVQPLLGLIRFGALTPVQFISVLEMKRMKDLLKDHDSLAILKHLVQPLLCPLPDWCCTKTWRGNNLVTEMNRLCGTSKNQIVKADKTLRECILEMGSSSFHPASPSSSSSTSSSSDSSCSYSSSSSSSCSSVSGLFEEINSD